MAIIGLCVLWGLASSEWDAQVVDEDRDALGREPLDSDRAGDAPRAAHLQWRLILAVAVGGALGTAAREALTLLAPPIGGIPWITVVVNVVGAFALGVLLETLALRGPDEGRRRTWRLFAGTGVLGGFTTYSALSTDTVLLLGTSPAWGALYALGTVLIGFGAGAAGIAAAATVGRARA